MQDLLTVTLDNPVASGAGVAAMACLAAWPLFRTRSTMLMVYIGNNLGFVAHYALLEQWTAAVLNGLMAAQTVVAVLLVRRPRFRWAYYALMPAVAAAGLITWQGWPSFLSAAATTLSTIGRLQTNEIVLRILLLASTPLWAAHDLAVGSLPGFVADLLSMAIGAAMLLQRLPATTAAAQRSSLPPQA